MSLWKSPWASQNGRTGPWLGSPWRSQRGRPIWTPSELFKNGEQGAWYDPSDLSTLYQDAAGTTPVTADGDPVGLMLDKSRGLVLGPELAVKPSRIAANWTDNGDGSYTSDGTSGYLRFNDIANDGSSYVISFRTTAFTSGSVGEIGSISQKSSTGEYSSIAVLDTNGANFLSLSFAGTIDNISVRELPGNHASQSVAASRPLYSVTPPNQVYETIEDEMVVTLPSIAAATVAIATATGADIQYPVDLSGGSYTINQSHSGIIILDRQLTASEFAAVTSYLNQKAGV